MTTSGALHPIVSSTTVSTVSPQVVAPHPGSLGVYRRDRAPPVDSYTGENPEVRFEDWLPTLDRAASLNGWSTEETLMQLGSLVWQSSTGVEPTWCRGQVFIPDSNASLAVPTGSR